MNFKYADQQSVTDAALGFTRAMATYKDDEIQDMIKNRFLTKTFD